MMSKQVQIKIREETREWLKDAGKKGETYDQIIQKLLKAWERV